MVAEVDEKIPRTIQHVLLDHVSDSVNNQQYFPNSRFKVNECTIVFIHHVTINLSTRKIHEKFGIPRTTVSRVLSIVLAHLEKFGDNLHTRSAEELIQLKQAFNKGLFVFFNFLRNYLQYNCVGKKWPLWTARIQLWLDGTHVRWRLNNSNLNFGTNSFRSYKLRKAALSTQVIWSCNGEIQWASESYAAASHDQGIMGGKCRSGSEFNYYAEIFNLFPLGPSNVPTISADTGFTHPDLIIPRKGKNLSSDEITQKKILRGLGIILLLFYFYFNHSHLYCNSTLYLRARLC